MLEFLVLLCSCSSKMQTLRVEFKAGGLRHERTVLIINNTLHFHGILQLQGTFTYAIFLSNKLAYKKVDIIYVLMYRTLKTNEPEARRL